MQHIGKSIQNLIDEKQRRDGTKFTPANLAKAINVDRSLVTRILSGEVTNPRVDTLSKIVKFFITDGFNLRLDDLLGLSSLVNINDQVVTQETNFDLPLYSMHNFDGEKIGTVSISLPYAPNGKLAFVSHVDIPPIFRAGSIFIVDTLKNAENNRLVAILADNKIHIRRYFTNYESNGGKLVTMSNDEEKPLDIKKEKIVGVVIKINAKT